jgi:acetyltransferase
MDSMNTMKYMFEPSSVAVIGASAQPGKIGYSVVRNLKEGGFGGNIYPINPRGGEIIGIKSYADISDVAGPIDVASICVPARLVFDAVKACADKGVKIVQIISSGFSEIGEFEMEERITAYARDKGTRVLGPNIFGAYSGAANCNATFSATKIVHGNVAILTQSGALGIAMIGKTAVTGMGLSAMVSLGNKADIDEADCLSYVVSDSNTRVILIYIEGIKKGERFIEALKNATAIKPVIILKSGRSKRGAMAAASHTGSLAGSDEIFDAIVRQCGALRAESLEEAFNWCKFLASSPLPRGDNCVIVTNGGGIGVMATDACEKYGIDLFDDQETLKSVFEDSTPAFGSTKNPIDITGGAASAEYTAALSAPAEHDAIHSTIALYCETATFDSENLTPMIRGTYKKHLASGKPAVYALVGGSAIDESMRALKQENIPVYSDVDQAVSSLSVSYRYRHYLAERSDTVDWAHVNTSRIDQIINGVRHDGRSFLLSDEGAAVMQSAEIPIPSSRIAHNLDQAVNFADDLGYPLVMKVVSRDILHKSDAGGVALNLLARNEVIDAYEAIIQNCKNYNAAARIDGIEVTQMVQAGTELIIGARRDPSFGPVVMCGLGGIYVEIMKDVVFRALPLNRREIRSMLEDIKSFPLLMGVRGEAQKDIDSIIDAILKVGTILYRCPGITDIEINPVMVYEQNKGLKAVDTRILISNAKEEHL